MELSINTFLLQRLLEHAAELGAIKALIKVGKLKPYLNKSEAFRRYQRINVERWIERGLITPRKDGDDSAAWRIDRLEIESIVKAQHLLRFL